MVIKSEKSYAIRTVIDIGLMILLFLILLFVDAPIAVLPVPFIFIWFLYKNHYVVARTLTMDQDGCTITYGKKERRFLWKDLALRRVEQERPYARVSLRFRFPHYEMGGAFFCAEECFLPKGEDPVLYCTLFHTWDSFFVNFVSKEAASTYGAVEGIFKVEKEEFLAKMEEWGVELEFV